MATLLLTLLITAYSLGGFCQHMESTARLTKELGRICQIDLKLLLLMMFGPTSSRLPKTFNRDPFLNDVIPVIYHENTGNSMNIQS